MAYDVDYFLKRFEAIHEDDWRNDGGFGNPGEPRCALGHCGVSETMDGLTDKAMALDALFAAVKGGVATINDGDDSRYQQPTPKQRILAALRDVKARQTPQSTPDAK